VGQHERESAESNDTVGKHIKQQLRRFDIRGDVGNHILNGSTPMDVPDCAGKASRVDVVRIHFDKSLMYLDSCNCSDGELVAWTVAPFMWFQPPDVDRR
jgi:hypothetical protein